MIHPPIIKVENSVREDEFLVLYPNPWWVESIAYISFIKYCHLSLTVHVLPRREACRKAQRAKGARRVVTPAVYPPASVWRTKAKIKRSRCLSTGAAVIKRNETETVVVVVVVGGGVVVVVVAVVVVVVVAVVVVVVVVGVGGGCRLVVFSIVQLDPDGYIMDTR